MVLRVGIVGCGGISHAHVRGWNKIPEKAKVVAVADVNPESARIVSDLVGGAEIHTDYRELMKRGDIDVIDVCLPHHLHKVAIVAAAEAGKHVMCEKPLCLSLSEAAEIRRTVERTGVTFMSAHNQVFMPTVVEAKRLLGEGILGQIYKVYSSDCFVHPQNNLSDEEKRTIGQTWRSRKETMGGGELIDTGYHPTYRLLYLAGSEPVSVFAQTARFRMHHWQEEDTAEVMLRFADGAFGHIVTSWAMPNLLGPYYFSVVGERGQIYATADTLYLAMNGQTDPEVRKFQTVDTFAAEVEHLADILAAGMPPVQSLPDATRVLEVILGAYRSVEEKRMVSLEAATARS
ncbi:MAG: Gfo/Idh/MocA family oxidoreductase [Chloroflexota bacterium]|nr:MAG: Gfo/Idh/MocA family oxidoreductase [Chloroflexota bacterium]